MKYLIFLIAIFCSQAKAEVELSINYGVLSHTWTDVGGKSDFKTDIYGVGLTYWHDDFGLSAIYNKIEPEFESGYYNPNLRLNFKHNYGIELKYRAYESDLFSANIGLGYYKMPTSQTAFNGDGSVAYEVSDRDDDNGYFVEIYRDINKESSVGLRYSVYSEIDSWNESTKAIHIFYTRRF